MEAGQVLKELCLLKIDFLPITTKGFFLAWTPRCGHYVFSLAADTNA